MDMVLAGELQTIDGTYEVEVRVKSFGKKEE